MSRVPHCMQQIQFVTLLAGLTVSSLACGGDPSERSAETVADGPPGDVSSQGDVRADAATGSLSDGGAAFGNGGARDVARCETAISGFTRLKTPTVWKNGASDCDYFVDGKLWIESSMTVEPGTTIMLGPSAAIVVQNGAVLESVGRADARIRFIGGANVQGFWSGFTFIESAPSRIEYTDIENAGQAGTSSHAALHGTGRALTFKHNRVTNSFANGAVFGIHLKLAAFEDNVFEANRGFGLTVSTNQVAKLDAQSDYGGRLHPNGEPFIQVASETLTVASTWRDVGVPYYVDIALRLESALTLEPGVTLAMDDDAQISLGSGSALVARGTAARPVVLTGKARTPGSWRGIYVLSPSPTNALEHARIEHAGRPGRGEAAVQLRTGALRVSSTTFVDLGGAPLCRYDGSTLTVGAGVTELKMGASSPVAPAPLCW